MPALENAIFSDHMLKKDRRVFMAVIFKTKRQGVFARPLGTTALRYHKRCLRIPLERYAVPLQGTSLVHSPRNPLLVLVV